MKALIEKGADVNLATLDKTTPLMAAAYDGHLDIVALLLERGADVNAKDQIQLTAVMYAAGQGKPRCVNYCSTMASTSISATSTTPR